MNPAIVILSVLFFTSTILCITMTLAWLHFGRQRYALSWAVAFGGGAVQWLLNALARGFMPDSPWPMIAASILVIATNSFVAIGARQRARLPNHYSRFIIGGLIASILLILVLIPVPHPGLRGAINGFYGAAMMPIAAAAIYPRQRKPSPPELAFFFILIAFGLYLLVLGFAGVALGTSGPGMAMDRYRSLLGIGLPPLYIATGIAAIFLLAGDLAESVRALITRDTLTGSFNRRGIEQAATMMMANARRHRHPLAVVIGDLDRFKTINDRFGHDAGDSVLVAFSDHVQASVREEDIFGRMGGDEFCLLLSDSTAEQAFDTIERIRKELPGLVIPGARSEKISASFGIAAFEEEDVAFGDILHRADIALYDAKLAGRNRIAIYNARAAFTGKVAR